MMAAAEEWLWHLGQHHQLVLLAATSRTAELKAEGGIMTNDPFMLSVKQISGGNRILLFSLS